MQSLTIVNKMNAPWAAKHIYDKFNCRARLKIDEDAFMGMMDRSAVSDYFTEKQVAFDIVDEPDGEVYVYLKDESVLSVALITNEEAIINLLDEFEAHSG